MLLTGPSTIFATASAFASPCATSTSVLAPRMVPRPWVRQCVGTSSGESKKRALSARVFGGQRLDPGPRGERGRRLVEADVPVRRRCRGSAGRPDRPRRSAPRTPRRPRPRRRPRRPARARAPGRARAARRPRARSRTGSSPGGRRAARRTRRARRPAPASSRALPPDPPGQLGVDGQRRRPGGQAEHGVGLGSRISWPILAAASRPTSAGVGDDDDLHGLPRGRSQT